MAPYKPLDRDSNEVNKFVHLGDGEIAINVTLNALAVDGPNQGTYVPVKASYNSATGNYELLTAGSGTTTTPPPTGDNIIFMDGSNAVWQDGSNAIFQ